MKFESQRSHCFSTGFLEEAGCEMGTERQGERVFPEEETAPPEAKGGPSV